MFFRCRFFVKIWEILVGGIMKEVFIFDWNEILDMIVNFRGILIEVFFILYMF